MLSFLTTPADGINYNFVTGTYAAAVAVFGVLLGLDKMAKVPQVEGFWIIFLPFIPCLAWSLIIRGRWLQQQKLSKSD